MSLRESSRKEWDRLILAVRGLDRTTTFVLVTTPLLIFAQFFLGNRRQFLEVAGHWIPDHIEALAAWSWWFSFQGFTGFVLPVFFLLVLFRMKPRDAGLSLGDWRFGLTISLLYLPLVIVGTWVLSDGAAFQRSYPHLGQAANDWSVFLIYELLFLFYWIGWEYLWRGYVLFGTARTFGVYAIFIQAIPFAVLHVDKPAAEAVLSVLGGIALGAVVWRCRSFWYAVPVHAFQMLAIDFWCTLRIRTGVEGKGISALLEIFEKL